MPVGPITGKINTRRPVISLKRCERKPTTSGKRSCGWNNRRAECWIIGVMEENIKKTMQRIQNLMWVVSVLLTLNPAVALAAQADDWKADWEKAVEAAKKEGQLTLYGSPDFEGLFV